MNYATLVTTIQNTTQNNEALFVAAIPQFVQTAEVRIHTEARLPSARTTSSGVVSTVVGSRAVTLPAGVLELLDMEILAASGIVHLLPKDAAYLGEMYPVTATQATPKFYARHDAVTIDVAPTPDQIYPVTYHYMALPTSIVTAGNTWLGDNFPQLLEYATLLEAYVFMKGSPDVMAYYKAGYDAGLAELKQVISSGKITAFRE